MSSGCALRARYAASLFALGVIGCGSGDSTGASPLTGLSADSGAGTGGGGPGAGGSVGNPSGGASGGTFGAGGNPSGSGGATASAGAAGALSSPGMDGGLADPAIQWVDPGAGPWQPVPESEVEAVCGLDLAALQQAKLTLNVPWVIVRHGRLCFEHYPLGETPTSAAEVYSTTKTLGALVVGIASYETRDLPKDGSKTGQLSDVDRVDHWFDLPSATFPEIHPDAHVAHVLAMTAHNSSLAYGSKQHAYDVTGSVQINALSDMVNAAISQDPGRLGANIEEFTQRFLFQPLGMTSSTWSNGAPDKTFGFTWSSSVRDMARVGLILLNRGMWDGKRVLAEEWVYKMSHPAFEDGNTAYGYLTWLSSLSNHSFGFSPPVDQGATMPCTPVALWDEYPHGDLSMAPDCNYAAPYTCDRNFDVGVFQALGLGGQVIQVHPGLDMVIAVRNEPLFGANVWPSLRPAVVAADPVHQGNDSAFCQAYERNDYAPDLKGPWSSKPK
jgi:hypothetical protein